MGVCQQGTGGEGVCMGTGASKQAARRVHPCDPLNYPSWNTECLRTLSISSHLLQLALLGRLQLVKGAVLCHVSGLLGRLGAVAVKALPGGLCGAGGGEESRGVRTQEGRADGSGTGQ